MRTSQYSKLLDGRILHRLHGAHTLSFNREWHSLVACHAITVGLEIGLRKKGVAGEGGSDGVE